MPCAVTAQVVVDMAKGLSMTRSTLSTHSQLEEMLHWPDEAYGLSIGWVPILAVVMQAA